VTPWPKSKPTRLGRCSRDNIEGYVWDWALDKGGAKALVGTMRSQSATCPIALQTGRAGNKELDESRWVTAIEQRGRLFLQKPVTALMEASQFSAALG
jgi:hypothetical protein